MFYPTAVYYVDGLGRDRGLSGEAAERPGTLLGALESDSQARVVHRLHQHRKEDEISKVSHRVFGEAESVGGSAQTSGQQVQQAAILHGNECSTG